MFSLSLFLTLLTAEICISRSLFIFQFRPSGGTSALPEQEPSRPEDGACAAPLLQSVSTSEGDFQPSPSAPSISQTPEGAEAATPPGASVDAGPSSSISSQGATGSSESLQSQTGEPLSPLVFPRKAPFSRGRLRLLSLRSMEEPRMAPPVKERFPILKHILSFMKDMVINESRYLLFHSFFSTVSFCLFLGLVVHFQIFSVYFCIYIVTCLLPAVMKCVCVCLQCSSYSGSEEGPGSECV